MIHQAPSESSPLVINLAEKRLGSASGPVSNPIAAFSEQGFKDALSRLASNVAIVACWDGETPRGALVSSLIGLSVSPPRMLFSLRHDASAHDGLMRSGRCIAAILSDSDHRDAELFSSSATSEQRFSSPKWRLDDDFAPRFSGGIVSFDLIVEKRIRAASHTIFIVEAQSFGGGQGIPLVYFDRGLQPLFRPGVDN